MVAVAYCSAWFVVAIITDVNCATTQGSSTQQRRECRSGRPQLQQSIFRSKLVQSIRPDGQVCCKALLETSIQGRAQTPKNPMAWTAATDFGPFSLGNGGVLSIGAVAHA